VAGARGVAAQAPTVTVSGVAYVQYGYQIKQDTTLVPAGHQNNFDVARSYINVIGKFGSGVTTRITADIDGRKAAANQLTFRLKYAFVAWTPEKSHLTYKLGEIHTALLDWEEALWDFRMQGTMPLERNGYISSSDFGGGIDGTWGYEKLNLQLGVYNGENYSGAPGDQRKDLQGRVSFKVLNTDLPGRVGGLRVTAYGQYGKPTSGGKRERYLGLVSYKSKAVLLAAEYALTKDSVTAPASRYVKGTIFSVYGTAKIPNSQFGVLGRLDIFDKDKDSTSTTVNPAVNKQTRVIAGVFYQLSPNLRLLADVDLNSFQNQGGANNALDATRQTALLQAQFTF
jgi:hypothetical protein